MRERLIETASKTGVFKGDLRYGRCQGRFYDKKRDYVGDENQLVMPLITVEPRDPNVWKKDPSIKSAKKKVVHSQHLTNLFVTAYLDNEQHLKSNFTLVAGKLRL